MYLQVVISELDELPWEAQMCRRVQHYGYTFDHVIHKFTWEDPPFPECVRQVGERTVTTGLIDSMSDQCTRWDRITILLPQRGHRGTTGGRGCKRNVTPWRSGHGARSPFSSWTAWSCTGLNNKSTLERPTLSDTLIDS